MNFLGSGKLHAGNSYYAVSLCYLHNRRTVPAGIVVRKGDDVKLFNCSHSHDITRGHVIIPAGRKAGMDVKIIV